MLEELKPLRLFELHQWRKYPQDTAVELKQNIQVFKFAQGIGFRIFQCCFKVFTDIPDTGCFTQPYAVLEVEEQTAVVQIDSANSGKPVVHYKVFGVDKSRGIFINFYPGLQQRRVVSPGDLKYNPVYAG